jgi:FkbM family methyltransferase
MDDRSLSVEVERLLSEPLTAVQAREQNEFDEAVKPFGRRLVLFGAGHLGRKTVAGLRKAGIEPIAFADNNPALWNHEVDGLVVLRVEDAAERYRHSAAFVITIWRGEGTCRMAERRQQLVDLGCEKIVSFGPLFWKYADVFLPHYAVDLPSGVHAQAEAVRQACSLWADEASRREYLAQLRWRLLMDFDAFPWPVTHQIYLPDDLFAPVAHECFVDCGAFDGDTLTPFLKRYGEAFSSIDAFEPDPKNFARLHRNVLAQPEAIRQKIDVYQLGVGARAATVRFSATGTESSAIGFGEDSIDVVALDELLRHRSPTFIKMDIEGAEPDALTGARGLISRNLPVLAVCVYHRQDHVWQIPLLISSFSDQYRFFLRPHLLEGWDLVCYAVPTHRLHSGQAGGLS